MNDENFLQLSGLQHYIFCPRQWALIHIENQWAENFRTVDGSLMHQNAHDAQKRTRRGDLLTIRAVRIHSRQLGVSGECDVVEFRQAPDGVPLLGEDGLWQPYPVEYKRGSRKDGDCDAAQLCAQAMCLEEMLCCTIPEGSLFYGEERHRQVIAFTPELRTLVETSCQEMHALREAGRTPRAKMKKSCNACSLKDLCLPKLPRVGSVQDYLNSALEEGET